MIIQLHDTQKEDLNFVCGRVQLLAGNLMSDAGTGGLRTGICAKAQIRVAPGRAMFSSV